MIHHPFFPSFSFPSSFLSPFLSFLLSPFLSFLLSPFSFLSLLPTSSSFSSSFPSPPSFPPLSPPPLSFSFPSLLSLSPSSLLSFSPLPLPFPSLPLFSFSSLSLLSSSFFFWLAAPEAGYFQKHKNFRRWSRNPLLFSPLSFPSLSLLPFPSFSPLLPLLLFLTPPDSPLGESSRSLSPPCLRPVRLVLCPVKTRCGTRERGRLWPVAFPASCFASRDRVRSCP